MSYLPLSEALVKERNPFVPDEELTMAGRVRRRMLNGEWFESEDLVPGASKALITVTLAQLKKLGFTFNEETFRREGEQWPRKRYQVTNKAHVPSDEQLLKARTHTPKKPKAEPEPEVTETHPCPLNCGTEPHASVDALRKHVKRMHDMTLKKAVALASNGGGAVVKVEEPKQQPLPLAMAPTNGHSATLAPNLGSGLQVFLLHLDEEGHVSVGLRDGEGKQFMSQLTGYAGPQ